MVNGPSGIAQSLLYQESTNLDLGRFDDVMITQVKVDTKKGVVGFQEYSIGELTQVYPHSLEMVSLHSQKCQKQMISFLVVVPGNSKLKPELVLNMLLFIHMNYLKKRFQ